MFQKPLYLVGDASAFEAVSDVEIPTETRHFVSVEAFLDASGQLPEGHVIVDMDSCDSQSVKLFTRLRKTRAVAAFIVQMTYADLDLAVEAMRLGAADVLLKPYGRGRLMEALGHAQQFPPERMRSRPPEDLAERLSQRELDVLLGLMRGLTNKSIALELGISHRTVEIHRARMMRKLGARSLSAVLNLAFAR